MTISYDFTRDDHMHFNMYHIAHSPSLKKSRDGQTIFIFFSLVVFGFALFLRDGKYSAIVVSLIVAAATLYLFPRYYDWSAKQRMNKLLDESKEISSTRRQTLTLKEEGIYFEDDKASGVLKWNGIEKVESSSSHTFLYTGAANAVVIPNTAFESVAEREKFMEMVMQYREDAAGISAVLA